MVDQSESLTSTSTRRRYDREIIRRVWLRGQIIEGNDEVLWRKDELGAWMNFLEYGNRNSQFGWEILDPALWRKEAGVYLLRPYQWENHLDYLVNARQTRMTSEGLKNVRRLL